MKLVVLYYVFYIMIFMAVDDKHSILNILLNSEEKELNDEKIVEKMSKVQFPLWIKDEVKKMGQYLLPFDY